MDPTRIGLFDLAEKRLAWGERRQALLAKNIANVSTPAYQPRDLQPFATTLSRFAAAAPTRTQPNHLGAPRGGTLNSSSEARPKGRAPDGNAVTLDEQLTKVADTETSQILVTTIYKKYLGLFSLALGRT
jgi:flagellar basal-body rod protein FlgB